MASGQIPCTEDNLRVKYGNVENLVPSWRKERRSSIDAAGGEIYDPWFLDAEKIIARDLRKFQKPLKFEDFGNLEDLSQLKSYKTLELLFRMNIKQPGDKFAVDADYNAAQYQQELESIPVLTPDGANYTPGGGLVRRT
jgi:hypothetical protein